MKTTATLLLGIFCLLATASCRCDFDEDEPRNKYNNSSDQENPENRIQIENDTIPFNK